MQIESLAIPDVKLITGKKFGDARGFFSEVYSRNALAAAGIKADFVQDNHSFSAQVGVVRGLHFQIAPHAQGKLVRVTRGAVLDVVGFAASIFHRGVRLIRVPSTTLGQADSGVGVKSAVNAFNTKNLIGAFMPPWAVVNDERLLQHLPDDHWRDGFSEAVKVALLKDAAFYRHIASIARKLKARDYAAAIPVVRRSAELHFDHITTGGDPFEFRHARPLDFGHWAAHKLEQMTNFSVSHGHAVSIGVALDCAYAELSGLANAGLTEDVVECLQGIGLPTWHPMLADTGPLLRGLEEFREHLGGTLTITLVRSPGVAFDVHEINGDAVALAARHLAEMGGRATLPGSLNGSNGSNGAAGTPLGVGSHATRPPA